MADGTIASYSVDLIKGSVRNSVLITEFDRVHLKKVERYIGRNVVINTRKMRTMAEGAAAADVQELNMPNGQLIYNMITQNHLNEIRAHLDPLTIRQRQSIVSQKVESKTLLGYACELGSQDIVKYLLDECEADISEGYVHHSTPLSPMRVSLYNLDVPMLWILLKRGTVAADIGEAKSCVKYAKRKILFTIESILKKYTDRINPLEITSDMSNLLSYMTITNVDDSAPILIASGSGDTARIKGLLADSVDTKVTDSSQANALCIAILNEKSNTEHFLLNHRVFSIKDHLRALELCGAKFITFESDVEKGLRCWRKAIRIRTEEFFGVSDKLDNQLQTDLGSEFSCEEQLDVMENRDAALYVQALIVFLRLLSPIGQVLQDACVIVARNLVFKKDIVQAIKVLAKLSELPESLESDSVLPVTTAINTLETLFRSHFICDPSNTDDVLKKLQHLMAFKNEVNWKAMLSRPGEFYTVLYIHLLKRALYNIIALSECNPSHAGKLLLKNSTAEFMKWHGDPYPTTLLHLAIEEPTALRIIPSILGCSDDVNCMNDQKNTPMHIVSNLPTDNAYLLRLVNLLSNAGCHIDSVNRFGVTPLMTLEFKGVIRNPLTFLSLKCLASQVIGDNDIYPPEDYPQILVPFIELHRK